MIVSGYTGYGLVQGSIEVLSPPLAYEKGYGETLVDPVLGGYTLVVLAPSLAPPSIISSLGAYFYLQFLS